MERSIELALRAIVRGLFHSDAVTNDQVMSICAALKDAAGAVQARYEPDDANELLSLAKGIKADTGIG